MQRETVFKVNYWIKPRRHFSTYTRTGLTSASNGVEILQIHQNKHLLFYRWHTCQRRLQHNLIKKNSFGCMYAWKTKRSFKKVQVIVTGLLILRTGWSWSTALRKLWKRCVVISRLSESKMCSTNVLSDFSYQN